MDPQQGPPQPDGLIGQTVGNYLVTQKLGEGGMGSVYLAEHPTIGKKVALKVLHAEFSNNEEVAKRFFDEARSVNNINHPNIVDIVDYGVIQANDRDQLVYFIMEYLGGQSLSQIIRAEAPLAPERAFTIALQVADALAASHQRNIVHRDLKPDNIMLIQRGREKDFVKLLDFGIAKLTDSSGVSSHKTRTGIVMGTPAYMSPEQCEGRANVDHRTDIYALGIVLYEMLTGRVPFIGEGYGEILVQHLTQHPAPPSQFQMLDPRVEVVVLKALEKRPELRYPTMDEFSRAMTDPFGYVAAYGGPSEFLQRQLMPSNAPMPARTSASGLTPAPGTLTPPSGIYPPGHAVQPPTTLGASAGQVTEKKKSKAGFFIAAAAILAAAGGGIAVVLSRGGGAETTQVASGSEQPPVPTPGSGSEMTVEHGSAGSAGSAVVPDTGSAGSAGSAAIPDTGSAGSAAPNTGSAGSAAVVVAPKSVLTFETVPANASIFIDGEDTGKRTPEPVEVDPAKGAVRIDLKLDGYTTYTRKNFYVGKTITMRVPLAKKSSGHGPKSGGNKGTGKTNGTTNTGNGGVWQKDGLERPD